MTGKIGIGRELSGDVPGPSYPAVLDDGDTLFWYDPSDLTTITKDGSDIISRVNDKLGSGNDLVAGAAEWSANTILFNGVNQHLKTAAFTWNQPNVLYLIIKHITYTLNDRLFGGFANGFGVVYQSPANPSLRMNAGVLLGNYITCALDTWYIMRVTFDGVNSRIRCNELAELAGNAGVLNMGGYTIGSRPDGFFQFSNIQVADQIGRASIVGEADIYNFLASRL